jgi:hypothetical protein
MSGLKINYHKSGVKVLGVSREESVRVARLLNYREGALPMKYLGIPVSNMKLYTADLIYVGVKVEKRLHAWQGLHLSSQGGVHPNGKQLKLFAFVYNGGILAT